MPAALRFGLAFGSLVLVRAVLDARAASIAVTILMFLFFFFAGVSAISYLGTSHILKRRPLLAAALTTLGLLLFITLPSLITGPLTTTISARVLVRVFFAWIYVCVVFAGFSGISGMKLK